MSSSPSTTSESTLINFEAIFNVALAEYTKQTGNDLRNHPLASKIDECNSAQAILDIFRAQAKAFDDFRKGGPRLISWLESVVDGLYDLNNSVSNTLNAGISLMFPPASAIFSAISILLSTLKSAKASYDALTEVFQCIESFVRRLMIYTKIEHPTLSVTEVVIKIMVELISVLALATKQIKNGRLKKYAKNFLGENEIQSVLQRLDRLTLEESKMTVAQTLDIVSDLVKKMEVVMEGGKASTGDIQKVLVRMQEIAINVHKAERDRLQGEIRRWLSAPDSWTNHNIARKTHYRGTATWFTQGDVFGQWKRAGHLLWIQGLPGSGKTILTSSVIEEVRNICQTGLATITFFYFDFRDGDKQDVRHLLSAILIQLCIQSNKFSEIVFDFFENHDRGFRQPSEDALFDCLKSMLKLPRHGTLYVVIDALDECSDSSGCPTSREHLLVILRELINLRLPHVRFCITSRPEIDIRNVLEPLAVHNVRLHEQAGQNQDIVGYINDSVRSDPRMRRWREEDKQLVIETLTRKAAGMFRWVHCQIENLRFCIPPSIRRVLDELPDTLDATYERTLLGINKQIRDYARRLFQCLVISIRPLLVKELAELFVIQPYGDTTPALDNGWRPEDPEEFILSTCSTLVSIVDINGAKAVQFSHFSVREYLTSDRIANSAHVSYFHILLKPAHNLLVRACLSTLFQLDSSVDKTKIQDFPLAWYAAEHWVDHARFEDVSSDIRDGMDYLFDRNEPYFAAWIWLCDVENGRTRDGISHCPAQPHATPLYYAALCGFRGLAERLLNTYPQDLNARGGHHETPLLAALEKGHLDIVLFLLDRGADVESHDRLRPTALYKASSRGYSKVVWSLLDHGADPDAESNQKNHRRDVKWTALHLASKNGTVDIAEALIEFGADINHQDNFGRTPLYIASRHRSNKLVRLLLDHGANLNTSDTWGITPLHEASMHGLTTFVASFLEHRANVDPRDQLGSIPLHLATRAGHLEVVQLLLHHGADANMQGRDRWTALHEAAVEGRVQILEVLLNHGADPHSRTRWGDTPFQLASGQNCTQIKRLLSEHTGKGI